MANPAELLYDQLERWNAPANQNVSRHRRIDSDRTQALHEHEIAMDHVSSIRELLDTLGQTGDETVDEFRRELPNWTAMVLSLPGGWGTAELFDPHSLQLPRILRQNLRRLVPQYEQSQVEAIRQGVEDVLQLLKQDGSIKGQLAI